MSPKIPKLGAILLAAGRSKRFRGTHAKVLHPLCGRPVLGHVLDTLRAVHRSTKIAQVCIVVPPGKEVEKAIAGEKFPFYVTFAVQKDPGGTGAAAQVGLKKLDTEEVMVLAGDMPLVRSSSLVDMVQMRRTNEAAGVLLFATSNEDVPYGRIVRDSGTVAAIVEAKDATSEQLAIRELNLCTYVFDKAALAKALPKLKTANAQGERYLTDVVELIEGTVLAAEGDIEQVLGTNTRADFANVARIVRGRILDELMDGGVTIIDPDSTYVDAGVVVGVDTVIRPNTHLEGATTVGSGCEIGPNVLLVDCRVADAARVIFAVGRQSKIGSRATVGPFAHLRAGTVVGEGAELGTFAEAKNAKIGAGVKQHHFSYLGDVTVGARTNIGAGTITCNYDGKSKHSTFIGEDAFIGSDTTLVAPVRVGRGAYTGAGSVVTRDVASGELVYGVPATKRKRSPGKPTKKAKAPKRAAVRKKAAKSSTKKKGA